VADYVRERYTAEWSPIPVLTGLDVRQLLSRYPYAKLLPPYFRPVGERVVAMSVSVGLCFCLIISHEPLIQTSSNFLHINCRRPYVVRSISGDVAIRYSGFVGDVVFSYSRSMQCRTPCCVVSVESYARRRRAPRLDVSPVKGAEYAAAQHCLVDQSIHCVNSQQTRYRLTKRYGTSTRLHCVSEKKLCQLIFLLCICQI